MEPREPTLFDAIRLSKTGAYLYVSPSAIMQENALTEMLRYRLCGSGFERPGSGCGCPNCYYITNKIPHPLVVSLDSNTFEEQMTVVYSYPPPVTSILNLAAMSHYRQMQLLIWLENVANKTTVLMTAHSVTGVLPTIISRSFVLKEIPKSRLEEEARTQASAIITNLSRGHLKLEEPMSTEVATQLARAIEFVIVEELELRMQKRRRLPGSESELQTLFKLTSRYLENPKFHQLPLLLRSYQMLALLNIR